MIRAPTSGHFSPDSSNNSDDEQLDDAPFLSHLLSDDHESFSEKFLRNILTHDYQNLMPRRREKFVEITKTVTVTEIVNGAPDKHPSSCEVKVTNVSPAGPHPVNVSIKHLHEKWHSCDELDTDLGKGTVIRINETHKPFNYQKKQTNNVYEDVVNTKIETEERPRRTSSSSNRNRTSSSSRVPFFNKSSDNIIDLEFRHPILVETSNTSRRISGGEESQMNGSNGTRRRFADLRKRVSTTTKTSVTETEKVTTTKRRSSSAHSSSSKRSYGKPEVHTLYYRKFVDEETKPGDQEDSDSGSVIIHRESGNKRSQSADPLSPIPPPRKRLGREESLHYYRDDEEVIGERVKSPEPGNTSVGMNDSFERRNITAGITSISMNNSCTDTSFESRFSTIPRASSPSSAPSKQRVNHIQVNVIGPIRSSADEEGRIPIGGRVGEDVTMDIHIEHHGSREVPGPPKPPRRSKWEHHHHQDIGKIGEPLATSTPMTTIERKQERISVESGENSRKSTRSARPPDINIIECDSIAYSRSPARTPATPIVVINQSANSRRSSQDLLAEPGAQRRRKSTVTDIDWYAAFNMKDPSSPTKTPRPPFGGGHDDIRKHSKDIRRRASDSSMIGMPPADIDLNQIFVCTSEEIKKDEKCQCNACRLIRMSEAERELRRATRTRQSRSYTRNYEFETRSSTLPSRNHRTAPVHIELEDIFNPKPKIISKPPTPPSRRPPIFTAPPPPPQESSFVDESVRRRSIDRSQVTTTTNSRDSQLLHETRTRLLEPSGEDWVGNMMTDANEWEQQTSRKTSEVKRKSSVARRISVDELTRPEKKRKSISLPPSDVSIDDIFTALTQKKVPEKEEKKTFIITRKQLAQDVEPIDFEDQEHREQEPIAPPRSKKTSEPSDKVEGIEDSNISRDNVSNSRSMEVVVPMKEEEKVISSASITFNNNAEKEKINIGDVISSATISLDKVFDIDNLKKPSAEGEEEDREIRKRIAEFNRNEEEKARKIEMNEEDHIKHEKIFEDSNISVEDIFGGAKPSPSDVHPVEADDVSKEEERIEKRVAEFEKSKEEEEIRRVEEEKEHSHHEAKNIFEHSNISMDDVFSPSTPQSSSSSITMRVQPKEKSSTAISLDKVFDTENLKKPVPTDEEEDKEIKKRIVEFKRNETEKEQQLELNKDVHETHEKIFEDSNISIDDVFGKEQLSTSEVKPVEAEGVSEEEERIEKRVAEFEKSKIEQDIHRVEEEKQHEHQETKKFFENSNISMDDVFSPSTPQSSSTPITIREQPVKSTSTTISLEKVFDTDELKKPTAEGEKEDEEIRKRIADFNRNEEEKARNIEMNEEDHVKHEKIFEDSNISVEDIFGGAKPSPSDVHPVEADDVSKEEERIEKRVAEFEKSKEEEEIRRVEEEKEHSHHETKKIFEDSNISMDDVFNISGTSDAKNATEAESPIKTSPGVSDSETSLDNVSGKSTELVIENKETKTTRTVTSSEEKTVKISRVETEVPTEKEINLDEVFAIGSSSTVSRNDEEDIKISKRIAEFEKSKQEKEDQKTGLVTDSKIFRTDLDDSYISMDDVFNPSKNQESTDTIGLDNVFDTERLRKPEDAGKSEDTEIKKRVLEFIKNEEEKSRHLEMHTETDSTREKIFTDSRVSVDDIFGGTETSPSDVHPVEADDVMQEEQRIEKRVVEFEKNKEEQELHRAEDEKELHQHTTKKVFEDSNIFMDDVFSPPKLQNSSASITMRTQPEKSSSTTISLEKVFDTDELKKPTAEGEKEDEEIRKRIVEFNRNEEEKARKIEMNEEDHVKHEKIFEDSNISVEDIFGGAKSSPSDVHPVEADDVSKEEKRIEKRVFEFEKSKEEEEIRRVEEEKEHSHHEAKNIFEHSNISMDDVFSPSTPQSSSSSITMRVQPKEKSSTAISLDKVFDTENLKKPVPTDEEENKEIKKRIVEFKRNETEKEQQLELNKDVHETHEKIFEDSNISIDDVFGKEQLSTSEVKPVKAEGVSEEEKRIEKRVAEFEKSKIEQDIHRVEEEKQHEYQETKKFFENSNISMDDVFSPSTPQSSSTPITIREQPVKSTSTTISLEKVFDTDELKKPTAEGEKEDEEIRKRIADFNRNEEEKARNIEMNEEDHVKHEKIFEDSNISVEDIFGGAKPSLSDVHPVEAEGVSKEEERIEKRVAEFEKSKEEQEIHRVEEEKEHQHREVKKIFEDSNISMDDVFNISGSSKSIQSPVESSQASNLNEFKIDQKEKSEHQESSESSRPQFFSESNVSLDEVFNSSSSNPKETSTISMNIDLKPKESKSTPVFSNSMISLEESFPSSPRILKSSETETTRTTTTTTTTTETKTTSCTKRSQPSLDDLFGPQTPTAIAISQDSVPMNRPSSKTYLQVPGKFNESMMSTSSTISLDDSFNNSYYQPKMRKELTLPVDNWIDSLVATATDEATKEAPKTPKTPKHYPSPTRISQEIKYEWVTDLEGVQEEEQHLQTQDNSWVSSVVYRPTLETSAYTLRASAEQEPELDMGRVFSECQVGKKADEECECSACRLTEKELELMRKRQIEINVLKVEKERETTSEEPRRSVVIYAPSDFSIDDILPLHIQTEPIQQIPSTSSPPLQSTRTYYLSPKVSETVTTTHQWKDADISMNEIFSPVSVASTANENRRFSNFYEDRSGWDTVGSEDSGVMSGGGRRRSSRIMDQVIDEAFKGIFETPDHAQASTSTTKITTEKRDSTQYDDYYITSLNQAEVESDDSEVDGENLDVTQFVDDILGKSMDEAAFLSSTKSLRDHTDTSIDRKKTLERMHPYYRTRTDTSIDKRSTQKKQPDVISEEIFTTSHEEGHDEILKLVFVDHSSLPSSESRGSLSRARSKPGDEELLEIEIRPDYFLIRGSYSLLIPKSESLGQMLQKLRDQNDSLSTLDFSLTRKLKKWLVSCIREKATGTQMASSKFDGLSSRGQSLIESVDHASATFLKMNVNKYSPTTNPNGIVNFCTAENNICTPLLEEKFKHLELFFPNTEHLARYPPSGGWPEAREVLVKYFKEFMGAKVDVEELVLTASTRTGYDVVSYCLFEQDDILLTNGPVYTGTISNVNERAQCVVECVETDLSNPRLEVKKYEEALESQLAQDNTVAGVIIVNPHNPLGVVFPPEDVVNICNWAASKNLHVVIDEVFANCVFDKSNTKFRPFLSYRHRVHRPENVAWLWSVSKDFGLPGLKYAVIHSANEGLRKAALKLQLYHPCSPFVQDFAVKLLSDSDWLREFHAEVTKRIAVHYRYTAENLKRLEIPFVPAQAGIFVLADFSKHCPTNDTIGELELFERLASAGVMLTPGAHQKCHVAGWFRLVFACSKQELEEGFRRLYTYLGSRLEPVGTLNYY